MGTPGMYGEPATSLAQHPEREFPAGTDAGSVASAMSSAQGADASWREQCEGGAQMMGSPVQPEIRQDTPVADMGTGYREAAADDPR